MFYQDDFLIPGISPLLANSRKQMRHNPKALINPLRRPHLKQRRMTLLENLGFFRTFAFCEVFAIAI
jgi:hypothetical protein